MKYMAFTKVCIEVCGFAGELEVDSDDPEPDSEDTYNVSVTAVPRDRIYSNKAPNIVVEIPDNTEGIMYGALLESVSK
jgi:hypothetical protein